MGLLAVVRGRWHLWGNELVYAGQHSVRKFQEIHLAQPAFEQLRGTKTYLSPFPTDCCHG